MAKSEGKTMKKRAALVNEVAATVEIVDVKFGSFSARYDLAPQHGPMTVALKCKASARADDSDTPRIIVLSDFVMQAQPEVAKSGEPCCEIRAQIMLTYESPRAAEFSSEHLTVFAQTNGIYNAWPYWREFVQSCTARMGLPPFVVPSLRLGEFRSTDPQEDTQPEKATPGSGTVR